MNLIYRKSTKSLGSIWGQNSRIGGILICPHVTFCAKKNLFKQIPLKKVTFSIAGAGFEPYDLRVMSPTSYQTALPRDIPFINRRCRTPGSNRYVTFVTRDFKSRASANSATPAHLPAWGFPLLLHNYSTTIPICQYLF